MSSDDNTKIIDIGYPEAEAFFESTKRAMKITPVINQLTFDDIDEIRALFSDLILKPIDKDFRLIPPFYTHLVLKYILVSMYLLIKIAPYTILLKLTSGIKL